MSEVQVSILPDGRLSAEDAAKYLGFSVGSLAVMRQKGTGPKFVKAGKVFYFKSDLDEWLNQKFKAYRTSNRNHVKKS